MCREDGLGQETAPSIKHNKLLKGPGSEKFWEYNLNEALQIIVQCGNMWPYQHLSTKSIRNTAIDIV